jgi:Flp pilus assembly protein TadG
MKRLQDDSGATAVEFALVMLPLMLLLMGIIDFGNAYSTKLSMTAAAREGVRVMAIEQDAAVAGAATRNAAGLMSARDWQIVVTPTPIHTATSTCPSGTNAEVRISYKMKSVTGLFGPINLQTNATMRCGG